MLAPRGEQLIGTLRRKKDKHTKFEDAWKQKVLCCLEGSLLSMKTMNGRLQSEERLDITEWAIEATISGSDIERSKFYLTRDNQKIKLKAVSTSEADLWVKNLRIASRRGIELPTNVIPKVLIASSFKHPFIPGNSAQPSSDTPTSPSRKLFYNNSRSLVAEHDSNLGGSFSLNTPPPATNPQMSFSTTNGTSDLRPPLFP
jgi:hypothetical protein